MILFHWTWKKNVIICNKYFANLYCMCVTAWFSSSFMFFLFFFLFVLSSSSPFPPTSTSCTNCNLLLFILLLCLLLIFLIHLLLFLPLLLLRRLVRHILLPQNRYLHPCLMSVHTAQLWMTGVYGGMCHLLQFLFTALSLILHFYEITFTNSHS